MKKRYVLDCPYIRVCPVWSFMTKDGIPLASIEATETGSILELHNQDEKESLTMSAASHTSSHLDMIGSTGRLRIDLGESLGGPTLQIEDKEGYASVLGRADLETTGTGRKTRTPAASLVLFGKDKKVLWSAP